MYMYLAIITGNFQYSFCDRSLHHKHKSDRRIMMMIDKPRASRPCPTRSFLAVF